VRASPLTFSGLLNALDGVGNPQGQIFVLTTNFREQLDSALIRNGRVDLHVEFARATGEQMADMFTAFFPQSEVDSQVPHEFAMALQGALGEREVSTAALQHYFVTQRTSTPEEAIANVGLVVEAIEERAMEQKVQDEKKVEKQAEAGEVKGKAGKSGGTGKRRKARGKSGHDGGGGGGGQAIHVHVHTDGGGSTNSGAEEEEEEEEE